MANRRLGGCCGGVSGGVLLLLLMTISSVLNLHVVRGMNSGHVREDDVDESLSTNNASSHVLAGLSYPSVRVGPYSWRYFRVEVPEAFAELSISLSRKWTGERIGNYAGNVPMVCFRFGSPPLPDSVLDSPEAAAMAAAKAETTSGTGNCAWFHSDAFIALTNMQIVAGVWYVGVFSDPQPSRFQSKMILRGNIFTFGVHVAVLGCTSPNLRGRDCGVPVTPLCSETTTSTTTTSAPREGTFASQRSSKLGLEGMILMSPGAVNHYATDEPTAWASLKSQHAGPKEWKHFALEVAGFALRLQVRSVCTSPNCNITESGGLNGTRVPGTFHLKYGALPDDGDAGTVVGSAIPTSVLVPRRGAWYIAVRNLNSTHGLEFDLHWHVESCSYGATGHSCAAAMKSMERVLVEDAPQESPFNSFYAPASRKDDLQLHSPWFWLSEATHPIGNASTASSGNWTYFLIEVPRGAAGAVLSVQLRRVPHAAGMTMYARLEGLPTPDHWDAKRDSRQDATQLVNVESDKQRSLTSFRNVANRRNPNPVEVNLDNNNNKKNSIPYNDKLSMDLVYPVEGIWCIGVHYTEHVAASVTVSDRTSSVVTTPRISPKVIRVWRDTSEFILRCFRSFVEWLRTSWRGFRSVIISGLRTLEKTSESALSRNMTKNYNVVEAEISSSSTAAQLLENKSNSGNASVDQPRIELSSDVDHTVQMQISVHGCVNECSGKGHCVTSYESSRLHFISYCHCDAAHGGIDCSVPLLVPAEETLHVWALIGSNAAALLPSFWAIRHQAYSEWVSYVASGVSSGFYHSCDAGGWCALSYDTLQFLDFWLSFLVVILTCLSVASLKHDVKAVAHVVAAIITAVITKENATSAWNVLLVVLMGLAGLLLGWALECWRLRLVPSWLSAIGPVRPVPSVHRIDSIYHRGEQLLGMITARFQWFYLTAGLGILFAAGLSWALETADSYWIWHSLWHLSIYTSAFLVLCSTSKSESWTPNAEGYDLQQPREDHPEASPMLQHTVELDAFATERNNDNNNNNRSSDDLEEVGRL